ncbi:hypothetical protein QL285_062379 [Trifolium repens]|nr:hypothetical protein QL285_062379 [Trifolium repens]
MVVLRDLSDVNEGDPSRPLPVGCPLERQVHGHFTRPDGSLNYSGYFTELLGVPITHSDLESSSGDDSSSGSSSCGGDCVIISPSSFTGKRRDESLALVVVGSEVATMNVSSLF